MTKKKAKPKKKPTPRKDFAQIALATVEKAIGGKLVPPPDQRSAR